MTDAELTPLEKAAWADFDQAEAAYDASPSQANRAAFEAATWAVHAAVMRAMEVTGDAGS
jgi:hypothetical protein